MSTMHRRDSCRGTWATFIPRGMWATPLARVLAAIGLAMILVTSLTTTALAVEIRTSETVTIGEGEVIDDDLVLTGASVVVEGTVNGDLVASGTKVTINGTVKGSLLFVGQTLILNGNVDGSVYGAAAALNVGPSAMVARNLYFAGYSYQSQSGSVIQRDMLMAGYQGVVNGQIGRNLMAALGALELNGSVGGDVIAEIDAPDSGTPVNIPLFFGFDGQQLPSLIPAGLRVAPEAEIGGAIRYTSPTNQAAAIQARPEGGIVFSQSIPAPAATAPTVPTTVAPLQGNPYLSWMWARLRELVSLLLVAGVLLWLTPVLFMQATDHTQSHPLLAGGWGFVFAIVGYVAIAGLALFMILVVAGFGAMTLGGLAATAFGLGFSSWGLLTTLFAVLVAYVSKLVVIYPLSHSLLERVIPAWNHYRIVPILLGTVVFVLLRSIPWFGPVLSIIVTIVGLGAIWLVARSRLTRTPAPQPVLTPA